MSKYSGKMLVKLRSDAGYKTRDNFYHSLGVELKKQNKSLPSYKTIQRMETEDKFSKNTLKIICEFLNISPDDLVEKNIDKKSENSSENLGKRNPKYSVTMTTPSITDSASQIKKAISNSNKRIFISDYEEKNLIKNQNYGINQLFTAIDIFADTKQNAYQVVMEQNFSPDNAILTGKNLNTVGQIEYCLSGLRSGGEWIDISQLTSLEPLDVYGLDYVFNEQFKEGEGEHPLYFYCLNYNYVTYWPFPEHIYSNYFHTAEDEPFMLDIYHPKKETIIHDGLTSDDFDPKDSNNIFRLTPTLLKYSIFILSTSKNIDVIYIPSEFSQLVNKEVGDVVYGVPDEGKNYLFGKQFKGSYQSILNDIQVSENVPKNYLDSEDFKIIYGKSSSLIEKAKKIVEEQNGKKYSIDKESIKTKDDIIEE